MTLSRSHHLNGTPQGASGEGRGVSFPIFNSQFKPYYNSLGGFIKGGFDPTIVLQCFSVGWSQLVTQTLDRITPTFLFWTLSVPCPSIIVAPVHTERTQERALEGNRTPPEQWNLNCTLVFQCFFFLFVCMTEKVTWLRNLKFSQVGFQRFSILFPPWVLEPSKEQNGCSFSLLSTHSLNTYSISHLETDVKSFFSFYWVLVQSYPDSPRSPPTDCIAWRGVWITDVPTLTQRNLKGFRVLIDSGGFLSPPNITIIS